MRPGRSSPLVRRRSADGCGSLWHNSVSSSTRSPMMTTQRPPLLPLVSLTAPQQGLHRGQRVGKKKKVKLKSQKYMQCGHIESLKRDMKHADSLSVSHTVYMTLPAGIFLCLSFYQTLSVSLMHPRVPCCRCFICLSESMRPPKEADRGRQVIDSGGGRGMKKPPVESSGL